MKFEKLFAFATLIATLLLFVVMAFVLSKDVFFTTLPQPITIEQYRGAAAVGTMIGVLGCFIALIGKFVWEHIRTERALQRVVNIPQPRWFGLSFRITEGYKNLLEKIRAESNSKDTAEVFRDSVSVYALMLEQQPWNPIIKRVLANKRKVTKPMLSLVVDNTREDEP